MCPSLACNSMHTRLLLYRTVFGGKLSPSSGLLLGRGLHSWASDCVPSLIEGSGERAVEPAPEYQPLATQLCIILL